METLCPPAASIRQNMFLQPIGANLNQPKSEEMPHSRWCRGPRGRTAHLVRQLAAAGLAAALMIGLLLCARTTIGASVQDDPAGKSGSQDEPKQDDKKPGAKGSDKSAKSKKPESSDVKKLEDLPLPGAVLQELKRGERSQRQKTPELEINKPLPRDKVTQADKKKFDELKRAEPKKDDLPWVDNYAKNQIYSLSERDWTIGDGRRHREEIEQLLDNPQNANEKFLAAYKESIKRYCQDLLDNHLWTRINAMRILAKVRDEGTLSIFCREIRDAQQHETVKFVALEGIEILGQLRIRQVGLETEAIATILDFMVQPNLQIKVRMAAVRALGAIGRPSRNVGFQRDVEVSVALLKIIRDPNIRRLDRNQAVVALLGLQIPNDLDYNFQYVAFEVAQFVAEAAAVAEKNPAIDDLHTHLLLVDASFGLVIETKKDKKPLADRAQQHAIAPSHGDQVYVRTLGDQVKELTASAIKIYIKPGSAKADDVLKRFEQIVRDIHNPEFKFLSNLAALNGLLKDNVPRSKKLTPDTPELGPPPALVGPRISPAERKDEPDEAKTKVGPEAGGAAGQQEP